MEKKISFFEFQNVMSVAKLIDPYVKKYNDAKEQYDKLMESAMKLKAQIDEVSTVMKANQKEIDAYESGIVEHLGFHAYDLIKKVMVPTGKTSAKTGKPSMEAQYLSTDIVKYNEATKEYIVTIPDEEQTEESVAEEVAVPTVEVDVPSSETYDASFLG